MSELAAIVATTPLLQPRTLPASNLPARLRLELQAVTRGRLLALQLQLRLRLRNRLRNRLRAFERVSGAGVEVETKQCG